MKAISGDLLRSVFGDLSEERINLILEEAEIVKVDEMIDNEDELLELIGYLGEAIDEPNEYSFEVYHDYVKFIVEYDFDYIKEFALRNGHPIDYYEDAIRDEWIWILKHHVDDCKELDFLKSHYFELDDVETANDDNSIIITYEFKIYYSPLLD